MGFFLSKYVKRHVEWASQVALVVKKLPANGEDPLEEEMATHSCILAWNIPWTEEPGGLQSMGKQKVGYS